MPSNLKFWFTKEVISLSFLSSSNPIMKMPAYTRLVQEFQRKGYTEGNTDHEYMEADQPLASIEESKRFEYLRQHLSSCHEDYIEYVQAHPEMFDKQFFKDLIAINYYSLHFENNIFEWIDEKLIDEELVMCAMLRSVNMRYCDRRDECDDWFYSVQKRKPELLTRDMYILGARCFASKRGGVNRFLAITPENYRTRDYYHALCIHNNTPVMEDIPEKELTKNFLIDIINEDIESIQCFTDAALETEVPVEDHGVLKVWQAIMCIDGHRSRLIPLNDERVDYFFSLYDKDSSEYRISFKDHYKQYLRGKNNVPKPDTDDLEFAGKATLLAVMCGMSSDEAIDRSSYQLREGVNREACLPIRYRGCVPEAYSKQYDSEEYLLKIYEKLGIKVLGEADGYYFKVELPESIEVARGDYGKYHVKEGDKTVITYFDRGPFYDRTVEADEILVAL